MHYPGNAKGNDNSMQQKSCSHTKQLGTIMKTRKPLQTSNYDNPFFVSYVIYDWLYSIDKYTGYITIIIMFSLFSLSSVGPSL